MDTPYISEYGWQMKAPSGWTAPAPAKSAFSKVDFYGHSAKAIFAFPGDSTLDIEWRYAPKKVDRVSDLRFFNVTQADKVNLKQIADILKNIAPPIGEIEDARIVKLADGARALEVVQKYKDTSTQQLNRAYELIFPEEPPLMVPMAKVAYKEMGRPSYRDPITGEEMEWNVRTWPLQLPGALMAQDYISLGHPSYEWITFVAPIDKFDKYIDAVRAASRSFHYSKKKDQFANVLKDIPADLDHP